MLDVIDKLKSQTTRSSTTENYIKIWRLFNKFIIRLDKKPNSWEERLTLFCAYMVSKGNKSATIKSYISAIKSVLKTDDYIMNENKLILGSLTQACRLVNDTVRTRLPIQIGLLEIILFELERLFEKQPFLRCLYQTIFAIGYYGLFRVGELTYSQHAMKAKDVHLGKNKDKILVILYSSKTHGRESRPQKIKICAQKGSDSRRSPKFMRNFCPFQLICEYIEQRGDIESDDEIFFVFRDKSPVLPRCVSQVLKQTLDILNLDSSLYSVHSLRIGRTTDLACWNYPIPILKSMGRWRSNAVYKYIRDF